MRKRTKVQIVVSFFLKKRPKRGRGEREDAGGCRICVLERERVRLLSRISGDPTVDSLQDKKESCSTQCDLHVGTRFEEF